MQKIHHKRNELFEIEFYENKECTEAFESKSHLYYLHNADCEAILKCVQELEGIFIIPYISKTQMPILSSAIRTERLEHNSNSHFWTLSDTKEYNERHFQTLLPNLSKYIPEDNAFLFLSRAEYKNNEEKYRKMLDKYQNEEEYIEAKNKEPNKIHFTQYCFWDNQLVCMSSGKIKNLTIFLPHGTQSELQKANEVAKELREKYGVEEVNLFVLHCFEKYINFGRSDYVCGLGFKDNWNINKIITTNSTGILPVQNNERLQVIDCKEIFEEYLKRK